MSRSYVPPLSCSPMSEQCTQDMRVGVSRCSAGYASTVGAIGTALGVNAMDFPAAPTMPSTKHIADSHLDQGKHVFDEEHAPPSLPQSPSTSSTIRAHSNLLRIPPPNRLPRVPLRHLPFPSTPPLPVDLADRRPLRLDERRERTEPRGRGRTSADARQRDRPVVDHDTNVGRLCVVRGRTRKN